MKSFMLGVSLFVLLFCASTALPAVDTRGGGSHNLILCDKEEGTLAYSYTLTREALFLQTRTETLLWPITGFNTKAITCLRVLDQIPNNRGGYVELVAGGPGQSSVELVFTSQWFKRMSFKIEIFVDDSEDK